MEDLLRTIQSEIKKLVPSTKIVVGALTNDAECIAIKMVGGDHERYLDLNNTSKVMIQVSCKSSQQLTAIKNSLSIEGYFDCGSFGVPNHNLIRIECYTATRELGKDNNNNYTYVAQYIFELEKKG